LVEAISVITQAISISTKFNGGWEAFNACIRNKTMCADGEIIRTGFMTPNDVESFVKTLERHGLVYLRGGEAIGVAVVDPLQGLATQCPWLQFGRVSLGNSPDQPVAACRLAGSTSTEVVTPLSWKFENSLSQSYAFIPTEHRDKSMIFLRNENGVDVYFNSVTGQEMCVGRTPSV